MLQNVISEAGKSKAVVIPAQMSLWVPFWDVLSEVAIIICKVMQMSELSL